MPPRRQPTRTPSLVLLLLGVLLVTALPASSQAADFTVTRTDDPVPDGCAPGDCSLREAVIAASAALGAPTIELPPGTYLLTQVGVESPASRDLDVTGDMSILGSGADRTIIDANGSVTNGGAIEIEGLSSLALSGVTAGGGSGAASGIAVRTGSSLTLSRSAVIENEMTSAGAGINAGSNSTLTITDSLVAGNETTGVGGGIISTGTSSLTNVTITGNSAGIAPGGLLANAGTATLNNVTITDNLGDSNNSGGEEGGGLFQGFGAVVNLKNTIIANNRIGSGSTSPDCAGAVVSQGHNLVEDTAGCTGVTGPGDITGQDPALLALAGNGGPTQTHALAAGSPALDRGEGCAATDQRGAPRPTPCDIGAYELVACLGVLVNRVGTDGDDLLTGTDGADGFLLLDGNDQAMGAGGNDALCADDGNDVLKGEGGNDRALAGGGNDKVIGGPGRDRLRGEVGKDLLKGSGGGDNLNGGPGRDRCVGQGGRDKAKACERTKTIP
jgi:Ca2+-binding RTX toxin-like protein